MEEKKKEMTPNNQGLSLREYFTRLPKGTGKPVTLSAPKEELVQEIARLCGKTPTTARRWIYGYAQPCLSEKEKIAALLSCTVKALFPQTKQKRNGKQKQK